MYMYTYYIPPIQHLKGLRPSKKKNVNYKVKTSFSGKKNYAENIYEAHV